jgi:flagellar motor switch protein FliM
VTGSLLLRPRTVVPDDFSWMHDFGKLLGDAMCDFIVNPRAGEVSVQAVNEVRYAEWSPSQPEFTILMPFNLGNSGIEIVIAVPGHFISQILNVQYGGSSDLSKRSSLSKSEMRLLDRLTAHLLPYIDSVMNRIIPEPATAKSAKVGIQELNLPQYRDSIVLAEVSLQCVNISPTTVNCFVGYGHAKKISSLFANLAPAPTSSGPEWQARMHAAALRVKLPMRAVLTQVNIPMSQLASLRPGDILPVLPPKNVRLLIAGRPLAGGSLGESSGRVALKIENMEGPDSEL